MNNLITALVSVQCSKHGKGMFATTHLMKGTAILKIEGRPLTFNDTITLGYEESYCLQIDMDKYIIPDHPFYLSNHSCEPNCGVNNNFELFTLRDVKAGEELCWDYSTSMLEKHWTMECKCGSNLCRQVIHDFDFLPLSLQKNILS